MRVLVTGGLGVNGAWVVRALLDRGQNVAVFENRDDTSLIEDVVSQVQLFVGDVCDAKQFSDAVSTFQPECIIHLAAFVDGNREPATAISVNVGGTANVCAAAVVGSVKRVVYTSSKGVYGPSTGELGFPTYRAVAEDADRRPWGMYEITKCAAEDVIWWYGRNSDVECVSMRFATIFGPGKMQRHSGSAGFGQQISVYSAMVELPATGHPCSIDQGGEEQNDLVYVLDVADAIVAVASAPEPLRHLVYNVSGGSSISTSEFARAIRRVIPDAVLKIGPGLDPMKIGAPFYTALDGTRIEEELGWRAQYDLDRAIMHYSEYVKARLP